MSLNTYFNKRLFKDSLKMINPVVLTLILVITLTAVVTVVYYPQGESVTPDQQVNIIPTPDPGTNPTGATGAGIANALIFVVLTLIGGLIFILFIVYYMAMPGGSKFKEDVLELIKKNKK